MLQSLSKGSLERLPLEDEGSHSVAKMDNTAIRLTEKDRYGITA